MPQYGLKAVLAAGQKQGGSEANCPSLNDLSLSWISVSGGAVVQTTSEVGTAWSKRTSRQYWFELIPVSGTGDRGLKSHPPHQKTHFQSHARNSNAFPSNSPHRLIACMGAYFTRRDG